MYIELHARSAFSFLEGASLPEDLVATCAHLNMPAMALLDRDGVYGSPRFHMAANKARIKAHIGAEVTCEKFPISNCRFPIESRSQAKQKIGSPQSTIGNSFRLLDVAVLSPACPSSCQLGRASGGFVARGILDALIEDHDDVGAQR